MKMYAAMFDRFWEIKVCIKIGLNKSGFFMCRPSPLPFNSDQIVFFLPKDAQCSETYAIFPGGKCPGLKISVWKCLGL